MRVSLMIACCHGELTSYCSSAPNAARERLSVATLRSLSVSIFLAPAVVQDLFALWNDVVRGDRVLQSSH